jgi:hypothetical protein
MLLLSRDYKFLKHILRVQVLLRYPKYNCTRFENPFCTEIILDCRHNHGVKWLCPYHGQWHKDTPTKRINITLALGVMIRALGLGFLAPQPKIYHAYGTTIFCDFVFMQDINIIVNNNMILDLVNNT